jgi:RecA/RadA recombinase
MSDKNDRSKALEAALSQIERAFGKGSVMKLGQKNNAIEAEVISTGSLGLEYSAWYWRPPQRACDRSLWS